MIVEPDEMKLNVIKHGHDKRNFDRKLCEEIFNKERFISNMSSKIDKII